MNNPNMIAFLIFFMIIILFTFEANSQTVADNSTESTGSQASQDSVSNFQPSLAVVISMLSIMFSLTFVLLLYAKFCHRASSVHNTRLQIQDGLLRSRDQAPGLDKVVIESLPFFRFSSLKGSREGLECAVCLARFEDIEVLRLLPKCKHAFHINCIDVWLEKHSTCPLCRQRVTAEDISQLQYSNSMRFLWNQSEMREESNLELYVEREDDRYGSSRFSIGSSFRKLSKKEEDELPIREAIDCEEIDVITPHHRFNHKIVISDAVMKNRWSNVSSSDLMFLNSEMLNEFSSARFSELDSKSEGRLGGDNEVMSIKEEMDRKRVFETKLKEINPFPEVSTKCEANILNTNDKRSMSEIVVHSRFGESSSSRNVEDERRRRLWLPIARKTVRWFANREKRPPSQFQGYDENV